MWATWRTISCSRKSWNTLPPVWTAWSGATFTSRAVFNAVNDAAEQAGCDIAALQTGAKPFAYEAEEAIEGTYDVDIVGAGGAGIAAAAQAAQNGDTVLVIEKNAEVGGNTLVSGGQYQSVMPYLVWDPRRSRCDHRRWL